MAVVTCFAADFAPRNWALCNGQLMAINQNQALFSLLGTTYGGNGTTNFALPDLRGRTMVGVGQGPGLSPYSLGQRTGAETTTLLAINLPGHVHSGSISLYLQADPGPGGDPNVEFNYPANYNNAFAASATAGVTMAAPTYTGTINPAGGNQPVPVLSPYLAVNYIICLFGVFPSRN